MTGLTWDRNAQALLDQVSIEAIGRPGLVTMSFDGVGVHLARQRHESEGPAKVRVLVDEPHQGEEPSDEFRQRAQRMAGEYARLERRRNAIISAGDDPHRPPAWAFCAETAAIAVMIHEGHNPLLLASPQMAIDEDNSSANSSSLATTFAFEKLPNGTSRRYARHRGDIAMLVSPVIEGDLYGYSDLGRRPVIHIGTVLPQTLLHGLVGRRVGELLDAPAFAGLDIRITSVIENAEGRQFGYLQSKPVALGEAPEGIDVTWRKRGVGLIPQGRDGKEERERQDADQQLSGDDHT